MSQLQKFNIFAPETGEFAGAKAVYEEVDVMKNVDKIVFGHRIRILHVLNQPTDGSPLEVGQLLTVVHPNSHQDRNTNDSFAKSPAYRQNFSAGHVRPFEEVTIEPAVVEATTTEPVAEAGPTRRVLETGTVEEGTFVNDKLEGQGKRIFRDGEVVWEGAFKDGELNGLGQITCTSDGITTVMSGEFCRSYLFGNGRNEYPDGTVKVGRFGNSELLEDGTIVRPDKTVEEGTFVGGDRLHGQGKRTYPDGRVEEGEFEEGILKLASSQSPSSRAETVLDGTAPLATRIAGLKNLDLETAKREVVEMYNMGELIDNDVQALNLGVLFAYWGLVLFLEGPNDTTLVAFSSPKIGYMNEEKGDYSQFFEVEGSVPRDGYCANDCEMLTPGVLKISLKEIEAIQCLGTGEISERSITKGTLRLKSV